MSRALSLYWLKTIVLTSFDFFHFIVDNVLQLNQLWMLNFFLVQNACFIIADLKFASDIIDLMAFVDEVLDSAVSFSKYFCNEAIPCVSSNSSA